MNALLALLTLATTALGILAVSRFARAGYPRTRPWLLTLFVAGWLNGAAFVWLIIGTIARDEFLVALAFGLPMGWYYTGMLPLRYRNSVEEAERRQRKNRGA